MLTKDKVFFTSLSCAAIFALLLGALLSGVCGAQARICKDVFAYVAPLTFMFPSVFFLSLFTYKLNDEIFLAWIRFTKWWIPLSIIATILTPETTGSSFVPFIGRGHVALAMSVVYLVTSLAIIIWTWATTRDGGEEMKKFQKFNEHL